MATGIGLVTPLRRVLPVSRPVLAPPPEEFFHHEEMSKPLIVVAGATGTIVSIAALRTKELRVDP
jgi:hypothetical protein